jgi:copper(I)-binding protein
MLMGLKSPLVEGEALDLVMTFENAGTLQFKAPVVPATASAPPSGHQP